MHRLEAVTLEFTSVNMVKLIYSSYAVVNILIFSHFVSKFLFELVELHSFSLFFNFTMN